MQPLQGEPFLELNDLIQSGDDGFDLNVPLDDDLGDLDVNPELLPENLDQNEEQDDNIVEDVIDASSDSSHGDADVVMFDLNEPVHVDVFMPVDEEGNQLMINPEEIPEDQLMDE